MSAKNVYSDSPTYLALTSSFGPVMPIARAKQFISAHSIAYTYAPGDARIVLEDEDTIPVSGGGVKVYDLMAALGY